MLAFIVSVMDEIVFVGGVEYGLVGCPESESLELPRLEGAGRVLKARVAWERQIGIYDQEEMLG
jgi:hypothetical protein